MPDANPAPNGAPTLHVRRAATFNPATFNAERNTVDMVWSTGARVTRMDWWTGERFGEELGLEDGQVDLTRMNAGAPLLNTHGQYDLMDQIGVVERAWVDGNQAMATVRFSGRPDVQPIVDDVRQGIIRNVSAGYTVDQWLDVTTTKDPFPVRRAVKWTPMEISLVPVPADAGAQVRTAPAVPSAPAPTPMETRMPPDATVTPAPAAAPAVEMRTAPPAAATLAQLQELQQRGGMTDSWILAQLGAQATLDAARDSVITELAVNARAAAAPARAANGNPAATVEPARDDRATLVTRMTDALFARRAGQAPEEHAREFMGVGIHGLMRELLIHHGERGVHRLQGAQLYDLVTRNIQSSSDFSAILVNSSNKFLRSLYNSYAMTWTGWTKEVEVPDFKTITSAGMGNYPEPQPIAENQSVPIGALKDEGETYNVQERSVRVVMSRIALVNDDLAAIDRAISNAALGGYTALRRAVYAILTANANMADGNALFSTVHSNLSATPATLSATGYKELRTLLNRQVDVSGQPVPPPQETILLVGPKNEGTAYELISPLIVPTSVGNALPTAYRSITSVMQDALVETSTTFPWYLVRTDVPALEIAYLTGQRTPMIIQESDIEYTGMEFRLDFNFGVKAVTWRSIAQNPGA